MADKNSVPQNAGLSLIVAMVVVMPVAMILGIMQIGCFPYSSLRNISYGIAMSMALVGAIWIIYTITINSKVVESEQKNITRRLKIASVKSSVVLLVVISCGLIAGLFSWMVIGDAVYFSSKRPHEYVTTVIKLVSIKGCKSSVEFFEEKLGRPIVQCPNNDLGQIYPGQLVKVKTRVGPLGVRIISVNRIQ